MTALPSKLFISALLVPLMLALSSCGGGSGGDGAPATGVTSLSITDAPVDDVSRVQLTFTRIVLQPASGNRIDYQLDTPLVIENLLELQGSLSAMLLPPVVVPAGQYSWVRLYVDSDWPDSYVEIEDDGGLVHLKIPSQNASGSAAAPRFLQLVGGFTVPAGGRADFTLDVDLRRALTKLTKPSGQDFYLLRPALRLVDNLTVGSVAGTIAAAVLTDPECTHDTGTGAGVAVYLYSGFDAATDDIEVDDQGESVSDDAPLVTGSTSVDITSSDHNFEIGFVPAGDYTVALTCQAADDSADSDESIEFLQTVNVTVTAGDVSTVDFE